jgi:hypothetical protein
MSEIRIFIARFSNGKHYIFESNVSPSEIVDNLATSGIEWVQQNLPIVIVDIVDEEYDNIDKYVLKFMKHYGIHNVRGGQWINIELTKHEIKLAKKLMKRKGILGMVRKIIYTIYHFFFDDKFDKPDKPPHTNSNC